ncbi:CDP-glycerol glycerophosphotransferase family protein [Terrilactibacillus sp. S3-3]|nr:CDP-glycerol glycerophosphotransferase family protein [Terrilactibacillus sp. S3-3]
MDQSETNKEEIENRWKNTDSVISYSKLFNQVMGKCFGINEERFKVTGSPRNDLLLNADGKKNLSKLFHIKANKYKFIFYMPTWRTTTYADRVDGSQNNNLFNMSQFDLSLFDQFLREHHIKLVIKLHPAEEMKALKEFEQYRSIFVVTEKLLQEKDMDIYEVLNGGDLLITDYSSVYFDFLLMNRPIIFTPTDIEAYSRTRGFVLNPYEEWTPGPKVLTQLDLTNEIVKSLDDPDYYKQDRIKIKNIVHDYQDAQSANRVWHLIEQTMNEQILNYK